MDEYEHEFTGKLVKSSTGEIEFTVVYVPARITSRLTFGKSKRLRLDGEINGVRFELALMPQRGKWFILVSKKLQKITGLAPGDSASVCFDVVDEDAMNVPRELQYALEASEVALAQWNRWTAGKRRGYCYRVDSAKRPETRERRVNEVLEQLLSEARS